MSFPNISTVYGVEAFFLGGILTDDVDRPSPRAPATASSATFSASLTLSRMDCKLVLDGSDDLAMDASSGAREPHQVSLTTYRFADPTSGPVARSHSSLD